MTYNHPHTALRLPCALLIALSSVCMKAQNISEVFAQMPDTLLPVLSHNDRLDLIDFIEAGLDNTVSGSLHGHIRLTTLTPTVLKLTLGETAEMQMCRVAGTDTLCLIHTAKATGWDSNVSFYTRDWKKLDTAQFIALPSTADFLKPLGDDMTPIERQNIINGAGIPLIRAEIVDDQTLRFTYTSANEPDAEYRERVKPHLTTSLSRQFSK